MTSSRIGGPRARSLARARPNTPALTGPLASAAWLATRGIETAIGSWSVMIELAARGATFCIEIYREEWGFQVVAAPGASWIRVTDLPFVHGRDELGLLHDTPRLERIGELVRVVEQRFALSFDRRDARIHTDVAGAEPAIRAWVRAL